MQQELSPVWEVRPLVESQNSKKQSVPFAAHMRVRCFNALVHPHLSALGSVVYLRACLRCRSTSRRLRPSAHTCTVLRLHFWIKSDTVLARWHYFYRVNPPLGRQHKHAIGVLLMAGRHFCETHLCACVNVSRKPSTFCLCGVIVHAPQWCLCLFSTQAELHITSPYIYIYIYVFLFLPAQCLCFHSPALQSALHGGDSLLPLQSASVFPPSVCCDFAPLSRRRSPLT